MTFSLPTTEPVHGPTVKRIEWDPDVKKRWWPFGWFCERTYTVPNHLHQRIISDPTLPRHLEKYHFNLSANRKGKLLELCVWQSISDGHVFDYPKGNNSIAQNLDIFQRELANYVDRRITICAMNVNTDKDFEHLASPGYVDEFWSAFKIMIKGLRVWRAACKEESPNFQNLLQVILEERWKNCAGKIAEIVRETSRRSKSLPQLSWTLGLPPFPYEDDMRLQDHFAAQSLPSGHLDIELVWMSHPPQLDKFLGSHDWNIYISEPYARRPTLEIVRFADLTSQGSLNSQILLATTSHRMLTRLRNHIDDAVRDKAIDMSSPNIEDVVFGYFATSIESALDDTIDALLQSVDRTQELDMFSRQNPSLSKVQYLLHLQESHALGAKACRENALVLSRLTPLPVPLSLEEKRRVLRHYVDDFDHLARGLDKHARHVAEVKQNIIDQVELFDKRRNRVVGVLIAIYVPLAFTTSFFGMNIEDRSRSEYWTNSTAVTQSPTAPKTTNITSETHISTNQPVTYNWSPWLFYAVAVPLTLGSIILPLIAGHVFRSIARYSIRERFKLRAFVALAVWLSGIPFNMMWMINKDSLTGIVPAIVGAVVGAVATSVNCKHRLDAQACGWFIWTSVCMFGAITGRSEGPVVNFIGVLVNVSLSLLGWTYLLLNWATAPKGKSWLIWRGLRS